MSHSANGTIDIDNESPSQRSARVAAARGAFRRIILPYPRQDEVIAGFDELRLTALSAPDRPMGGIRLLAPIGTGKTYAAELFKRHVEASASFTAGEKPVVIATLNTSGVAKSVPISILTALGEYRPDRGTEPKLWMRTKDALKEAKTQILIIDEVDRATRRPTISSHIAGALRDLSDERIVPIAFLGTDAAANLFRNCPDLDERLDAQVTLNPLDPLVDEDLETFTDLVNGFDAAIVDLGILRAPSEMTDSDTVFRLAQASGGVLRQLSRIVETALASVVRRDGDAITREDLADAVEEWAIPKGYIDYNPFSVD